MTFNLNSPSRFNKVVHGLTLAGLMAAGASAMAQGTASVAGAPGPSSEHMGKHDPATMQAMMALA